MAACGDAVVQEALRKATCCSWAQRDTMDGVIGEFADAGLLLRSASAALGLDFCSDIFCDPEAVLVHDVSLVFGEIDQPFVGWSQQRRIALIQLGWGVSQVRHAGSDGRLLLDCCTFFLVNVLFGC